MRIINVFILALILPILVLVGHASYSFYNITNSASLDLKRLDQKVNALNTSIISVQEKTLAIKQTASKQEEKLAQQSKALNSLTKESSKQTKLSDNAYEQKIVSRLGKPIDTYQSPKVKIEVFSLQGIGFRGYIAKVKLYEPKAFKVLLGNDKIGGSETTSAAVKRTGAIFGINAGGFYNTTVDGKNVKWPLGNTVIDGKLLGGFTPTYKDLFFAGVDSSGELLGGKFTDEKQLMVHEPVAGVSFVPMLIKDRKALTIPTQWANQKNPRTIIGEYGNDDLIFIVVDGRQSDWSNGVTLEYLQQELLDFGVVEAYNLDGGGSSSFVFKGKVLNKPSDGRERTVTTNIVIMP